MYRVVRLCGVVELSVGGPGTDIRSAAVTGEIRDNSHSVTMIDTTPRREEVVASVNLLPSSHIDPHASR